MKCASVVVALILVVTMRFGEAKESGHPQDNKILRDYVLTMDKVRRFDAANRAFEAAAKNDKRLQADGRSMNFEPQRTFDDIVAKFRRHRLVYAFFAKERLSPLDTAAIPIALSYACMANRYPQIAAKMADRTSPAQIAFCKAHKTEIESMETFSNPR